MLDLLNVFRIRFAGRPLMLAAVAAVLLLIARRLGSRQLSGRTWRLSATRLTATVALLALLAYPVIAIWYASEPHFFDNAEPTMIAIGWMFHVGQPIYHATDVA